MSYVKIEKAILHIMDTGIDFPVLSDKLMTMDEETDYFLTTHIARLMEDAEFKECSFNREEEDANRSLIEKIHDDNFIETTKALGQSLFGIIHANLSIPPGDMVCCFFSIGQQKYFGILKFDYKPAYIHNLVMDEELKETGIIKQKAAIANEKQKINECILINMYDQSVMIKERKFDINDAKSFYLSTIFLKVDAKLSMKQKYDILERSAKEIVKEYYNDDVKKTSHIKTVMQNSIDDNMVIEVDEMAREAFSDNSQIHDHYKNKIAQKGFDENAIQINEQLEKKIHKKQKISTDTGIEISVPTDYMNDSQKIEFFMNEDGTVSILIKSINHMIGK